MLIPFYDNSNDDLTIEQVQRMFVDFEELSEIKRYHFNVRQKTILADGSDALVSHYRCTTRNICNSIMRLTCYHTIFSTLKQQTDPTIPIDSVINSVPVPQAVFTSSEQEMPVVVANMMYEGYADRLLTDSILLMLYETEVDHAEQDVIHYLVELAKQSIQNIGRYLSTTKIHFQTHSDYCLNQYELQPQYLSLMMNRISLFHRSKLRSEKRDYSALGPSQPSPKDLPYFHSNTIVQIIQYLIQKQISPQSLLKFIYERMDFYQRLLKIESQMISLYSDIMNNPGTLQSLNVDEVLDLQSIRRSLHVNYDKKQTEETNDKALLLNALTNFFKTSSV